MMSQEWYGLHLMGPFPGSLPPGREGKGGAEEGDGVPALTSSMVHLADC